MLDNLLIEDLRNMALNNKSATEIVQYLSEKLDSGKSHSIMIIVYLKEALMFKINEGKMVFAWNYFEDGTWSKEEIDNSLNPVINEKRWINS